MKKDILLLELEMQDNKKLFPTSISEALIDSREEMDLIEEKLNETVESINALKPNCDKFDYTLSVCSGILCGIVDIFLVGDPLDSKLGKMNDKWVADKITSFSKLCGYKGEENSLSDAIEHLEKKFKVPYDQSTGGEAFKQYINLTPNNHHFKSLGHNPTILGLFFSILNQFNNTSSFVSEGSLITITNFDSKFELQGNSVISKIYCGFINWIGHLLSDVSGSSSSKGRGMGLPSPFYTWINDLIVIKNKLKIPVTKFDKAFNDLSIKIFEEGYDLRFQSIQVIPVIINELIVRCFYSIRRLFKCLLNTKSDALKINDIWKECNPFSSPDIKRMLLVAHGVFCAVDVSDAVISGFLYGGGTFNVEKCIMKINVVGIGRFTILLYGEIKNDIKIKELENKKNEYIKEKSICEYYIDGLEELSQIYDDKDLVDFVYDLKNSDMYKEAFNKSIELARKRNVPEDKILKSKEEIDRYFKGENNGKK